MTQSTSFRFATQFLVPALLLAVPITLAYRHTFSVPLLLDDTDSIVGNATIRNLFDLGTVLNPPNGAGVGGRPLLNLTYAGNYAIGGLGVKSYHTVNLCIHALTAFALFGLIRRTLQSPVLGPRFGRHARPLAFVVALLWALHPLATESVTYLSQRAESLTGLFYVLTLYAVARSAVPTAGWIWRVVAVLACACGMATKEIMVTAPVVALLFDRTFFAGTFRAAWRRRAALHVGLLETWFVLAALMIASHPGARGVGFGLGRTAITYAMTEARVLAQYLGLVFWPHPLVFDYGSEIRISPWAALPWVAAVGALLGGTLVALRTRPVLGFAGAAFLLLLAPTSSIVPLPFQPMAESRMYLPSAMVVACIVLGAYAWLGRRSMLVALAGAIALGCATGRRNRDYHSELALWSDTVAKRPDNSRAQSNMGNALMKLGRTADALPYFQAAVRLKPDYADALVNLGAALAQLGRPSEAVDPLERAVRFAPGHALAWINLAYVLVNVGRPQEALAAAEAALRLDPGSMKAQYNAGLACVALGQPGAAIAHFDAALRAAPDSVDIEDELAGAYERAGNHVLANAHYQAVLRRAPQDGRALQSVLRLGALGPLLAH